MALPHFKTCLFGTGHMPALRYFWPEMPHPSLNYKCKIQSSGPLLRNGRGRGDMFSISNKFCLTLNNSARDKELNMV